MTADTQKSEIVEELPFTLQELVTSGLAALLGKTVDPIQELGVFLTKAVMAIGPSLNQQQVKNGIIQAIQEAQAQHPDFAAYVEPMTIAASSFLPYPWRLSAPEYVEGLYVIAKHANFMQPARWRTLTERATGVTQ